MLGSVAGTHPANNPDGEGYLLLPRPSTLVRKTDAHPVSRIYVGADRYTSRIMATRRRRSRSQSNDSNAFTARTLSVLLVTQTVSRLWGGFGGHRTYNKSPLIGRNRSLG